MVGAIRSSRAPVTRPGLTGLALGTDSYYVEGVAFKNATEQGAIFDDLALNQGCDLTGTSRRSSQNIRTSLFTTFIKHTATPFDFCPPCGRDRKGSRILYELGGYGGPLELLQLGCKFPIGKDDTKVSSV